FSHFLLTFLTALGVQHHIEDRHISWLGHVPVGVGIDVDLMYDHQIFSGKRGDVLSSCSHSRECSLVRTAPGVAGIHWHFPCPPEHAVPPAAGPAFGFELIASSEVCSWIHAEFEEAWVSPQSFSPHAARDS